MVVVGFLRCSVSSPFIIYLAEKTHMLFKCSVYGHTNSSNISAPASDRLSAIKSSSTGVDESGSIHHRWSSSQEVLPRGDLITPSPVHLAQ